MMLQFPQLEQHNTQRNSLNAEPLYTLTVKLPVFYRRAL